MKTIRYLFFGALLLLTGSFSLNAQVIIVSNGNFEQASTDGNIPSWGNEYNDDYNGVKWVGDGSNSIDDAVFKEGKQSGHIAGKGAMNWIKGIPGNKTYDISFWFRSDAPTGVNPTVSMQGSGFAYGGGLSDADLTKLNTPHDAVVGEWVFVEIKGIRIPETTDDFILGIASNYDGFWIDDVKMVEATGTKSPQTITFADITKQLGDANFTLSAKASSYLPVSYTIADASIATITNGKVHILKIGSTTITASQAGDNAYEAANKTVTLTVTAKPVAAAEVPNGNFEQVDADGIPTGWGGYFNDNWDGITTDGVSVDNTVFKEGKQSGYFTGRTAVNWIKNFPGNKTYDISFWFRTNASTINGVIPIISLSGTLLASGAEFSPADAEKLNERHEAVAGEWLFVEAKGIKFPDITDDLILFFQGNYNGMWLDDVRIVEADPTGINEVRTQLPVRIQNGNVIVTTESGSLVEVFNALGINLQSQTTNSSETTLSNLPKGQVLIVRSGHAVAKVIL